MKPPTSELPTIHQALPQMAADTHKKSGSNSQRIIARTICDLRPRVSLPQLMSDEVSECILTTELIVGFKRSPKTTLKFPAIATSCVRHEGDKPGSTTGQSSLVNELTRDQMSLPAFLSPTTKSLTGGEVKTLETGGNEEETRLPGSYSNVADTLTQDTSNGEEWYTPSSVNEKAQTPFSQPENGAMNNWTIELGEGPQTPCSHSVTGNNDESCQTSHCNELPQTLNSPPVNGVIRDSCQFDERYEVPQALYSLSVNGVMEDSNHFDDCAEVPQTIHSLSVSEVTENISHFHVVPEAVCSLSENEITEDSCNVNSCDEVPQTLCSLSVNEVTQDNRIEECWVEDVSCREQIEIPTLRTDQVHTPTKGLTLIHHGK